MRWGTLDAFFIVIIIKIIIMRLGILEVFFIIIIIMKPRWKMVKKKKKVV